MADRWKAAVNPRVCVRTGLCVATAPKEFQPDERGQGHATAETLPPSSAAMDAAESCPVEAITISDADTGEPLFPPGRQGE